MKTDKSLKEQIKLAVDESQKKAMIDSAEEKRKFPRSKVVWHAELHGHQQSIQGTVQDMSVNGAKFKPQEPFFESKGLSLNIKRFGKLDCNVVWRHADTIGLQFEATPDLVHSIIGSILPRSGDFER